MTTTKTSIDSAARTEEGWLIVDLEYRNDDPWVLDDCWHRGAHWVYRLRGTSVVEVERTNDGIGDCHDRFYDRVANEVGYVGRVEVIQKGGKAPAYRVIKDTVYHSAAWLATRKIEMAELDAKYADCPPDAY